MKQLYMLAFGLLSFVGHSQVITIPDANFKNAMITTVCADFNDDGNPDGDVDINNNGEIEVDEALQVFSLFYTNPPPLRMNDESAFQPSMVTDIADLTGIEEFTNLKRLDISNNLLTSLDVSMLGDLMILRCGSNDLTTLNISNLVNLQYLYCEANELTSLNLENLTALKLVHCSLNNIGGLSTSNLPELIQLSCSDNPLAYLVCVNNQMLDRVYCSNTLLYYLNLNDTAVSLLYCSNNPNLSQVFLKNGVISPLMTNQFPFPINTFDFTNNPDLEFVCGDDAELDAIMQSVGSTVNVNSYCTMTPGGEYNTISGNVLYDCGGLNINVPNMQISINDGSESALTYSTADGGYIFYTGTGTFTGGVVLENLDYFTFAPAGFSENFNSTGENTQTDFCITANGIHPDVEVTLMPTNTARPGFDADYLIIYKNKGTETQSGTVTLTYEDAVLDFVSATPVTTAQSLNTLSWDFTDLLPFESRSVIFNVNVNSPVETPPVNIDDILSFSANIALADETPDDNTSVLDQIVVGSFDPNDKIVTEGTEISISQIGNFLHYIIRFQNTGTAAAENVVIKDVLSSLLEATSLQVIGASHSFETTLTSGNKIEFFFENINLPAVTDNESGSHGYIAFRIKPAQSVTVGSIIQNTASIYFDFNFAIVTNTTSTTVTALGLAENNLDDSVTIYPNPAKDYFSVSVPELKSISIYNMLGQLVKSVPSQSNSSSLYIDVSEYTSGTYIIKLDTAQGTIIKQLLKN